MGPLAVPPPQGHPTCLLAGAQSPQLLAQPGRAAAALTVTPLSLEGEIAGGDS